MQLHKYQLAGRDFLLNRCHKVGAGGLWFEPGLGKTITTLDAILTMKEFGEIKQALVVAPARVIATAWPKEIKAWGMPLSWGWLKGNDEERAECLAANHDIYFVGSENLPFRELSPETRAKRKYSQMAEWLLKSKFRPDLLVVDESTKFKSWKASRSKIIRKIAKRTPRRITLTGTPTPNGLGDIFPQHFLLDSGATLTPYIGRFRERFMQRCGYEDRGWEMRPEMVEELQRLLAPWYLTGTAVEHLDMPTLILNEIDVELPPAAMKVYKDMQKNMFAEIGQHGLTTLTGGGKYNLCRQIAGGNAYDEDKVALSIHNAKLDALEDLYEELNGKPLIVAYWYDHEYQRIKDRFPDAAVIRGGTKASATVDIINRWQRRELGMIIVQASALSHGVDGLQKAGNDLCWYTLTDQPEVKFQLERRIFRQGVEGDQVRIHYLLAKGTLDKTIYKVLNTREASQKDVMDAIKRLAV